MFQKDRTKEIAAGNLRDERMRGSEVEEEEAGNCADNNHYHFPWSALHKQYSLRSYQTFISLFPEMPFTFHNGNGSPTTDRKSVV